LILLPLFIIAALLGGHALIKADERLGPSEMFILIAGLIAACSTLEILSVWWENRHADEGGTETFFTMVGRRGIVEKECSPEGTVKIGQEIWTAISYNRDTLETGEQIVVKDRQGLRLYVERSS